MVIENELVDFTRAAILAAALVHWAIVVLILISVGLAVAFLWELSRAVERARTRGSGSEGLWIGLKALSLVVSLVSGFAIANFLGIRREGLDAQWFSHRVGWISGFVVSLVCLWLTRRREPKALDVFRHYFRDLGTVSAEALRILSQILGVPLLLVSAFALATLVSNSVARGLPEWAMDFARVPAELIAYPFHAQERTLPSWWTPQAQTVVSVVAWGVVFTASVLGLWWTRQRFARTFAVAGMTIKDSLRQRVLYVLPFFLVPMLFAGWYLPTAAEGRLLYLVSFVWISIGVLMFLMVLFLVAMSIPNDIKSRTIQTVLTKPVRRAEFVLGRILGFVIVFTGMLGLMSVLGFAYIFGQIAKDVGWEFQSSPPFVSVWYKIDDPNYTARRTIYASMSDNPADNLPGIEIPFYFQKDGILMAQATNVGEEWGYRSHIEGRSGDAAFWHYHFDPTIFDDSESVRVQMRFDIFKTTKGNPSRPEDKGSGVFCQLQFFDAAAVVAAEDPRKTRELEPLYSQGFPINNNRLTEINIPTKTVASGHLVVKAECTTGSQFLGMAQHDLYFLSGEGSFGANYFKAMFGLWLQVVFWISVAVAASTLLNGFVSILVTVLAWVVGLWHGWVMKVASGTLVGGGPTEAFIRMTRQANQVTELDPGWRKDFAKWADPNLEWILSGLARMIPNLSDVTTIANVADGYDIALARIVTSFVLIAAYVIPVVIVGCLLFRNREVAA